MAAGMAILIAARLAQRARAADAMLDSPNISSIAKKKKEARTTITAATARHSSYKLPLLWREHGIFSIKCDLKGAKLTFQIKLCTRVRINHITYKDL